MRAEILLQLGAAAIRSLDGRAVEHLQAAVESAATPQQRRSALMELARAQLTVLDLDGAADTFELAVAESAGDRELELSAIAELSSAELNLQPLRAGRRARVARAARRAGRRDGRRAQAARGGGVRRRAGERAGASWCSTSPERALGDGALIEEQSCASMIVLELLLRARARRRLRAARARARRARWATPASAAGRSASASPRRSAPGCTCGAARSAPPRPTPGPPTRSAQLHGATPLDPFVSAFLDLGARRARPRGGGRRDARRALPGRRPGRRRLPAPAARPRASAGSRSGIARPGSPTSCSSASASCASAASPRRRWRGARPQPSRWRRRASRERAAELAAEELVLAEALGTERAIGIALRAVALTGPPEQLIETLETLHRPPRELRRRGSSSPGASTELGAALRRERRGRDAREPLHRAVELARACGSKRAEQRALDELGASGERQQRPDGDEAPTAIEELTPSELRAARMAAAGRTNREIAEDLFVTPRTIEVHLTRAYRKLRHPLAARARRSARRERLLTGAALRSRRGSARARPSARASRESRRSSPSGAKTVPATGPAGSAKLIRTSTGCDPSAVRLKLTAEPLHPGAGRPFRYTPQLVSVSGPGAARGRCDRAYGDLTGRNRKRRAR